MHSIEDKLTMHVHEHQLLRTEKGGDLETTAAGSFRDESHSLLHTAAEPRSLAPALRHGGQEGLQHHDVRELEIRYGT